MRKEELTNKQDGNSQLRGIKGLAGALLSLALALSSCQSVPLPKGDEMGASPAAGHSTEVAPDVQPTEEKIGIHHTPTATPLPSPTFNTPTPTHASTPIPTKKPIQIPIPTDIEELLTPETFPKKMEVVNAGLSQEEINQLAAQLQCPVDPFNMPCINKFYLDKGKNGILEIGSIDGLSSGHIETIEIRSQTGELIAMADALSFVTKAITENGDKPIVVRLLVQIWSPDDPDTNLFPFFVNYMLNKEDWRGDPTMHSHEELKNLFPKGKHMAPFFELKSSDIPDSSPLGKIKKEIYTDEYVQRLNQFIESGGKTGSDKELIIILRGLDVD